MPDSRKQKLIDLGDERLADALLDLTAHSDSNSDFVERLIATPDEKVQPSRLG